MKILTSVLLAAAIGCGGTNAATDPGTEPGPDAPTAALRKARVVDTLGQGLSLREGPGQDHAVLRVMPEGAILDVLAGPVDGWYQVTYEATTGWAFGDYLAIFDADDPPPGTAGFNFLLPWQAGVKFTCTQGHNGGSHTDYNAYAWDFGMPVGTPVLAANSGVVRAAKGNSTGGGCDPAFVNEANYVVVTRSDGFESLYVHLSSVTVAVGAAVKRGELIGYSGQTGYSCGAHLHYQVQPGPAAGGTNFYANPSVPSAFHDSGTAYDPKAGDVLTSRNSVTSDVP